MYWMFIAACSMEMGASCVMLADPKPYKTWEDCKVVMIDRMNSRTFDGEIREILSTEKSIAVNGLCATDDEKDEIVKTLKQDDPEGLVKIGE